MINDNVSSVHDDKTSIEEHSEVYIPHEVKTKL